MKFSVSYLVLYSILSFLPLSATALSAIAQPFQNVSFGSSLEANAANFSWLSPSGDFAFGFQQIIPGGGYLLAVWFDKIPEKTMVWSANRDNPAEEGSRIQLLSNGTLVLSDPRGAPIWAANSLHSGVSYGAMLDTGNFVLSTNTSSVVWQSFDDPTDTLLPSQILNQGGTLISSFSAANYSRGRFLFIMQTDGNLGSWTRNFPYDKNIFQYWETDTVGNGFQLIFNQSGYIYLTAENGTIINTLSSNGPSTDKFYQRAILEYDGVLRHYVYPKSSNSTSGRAMEWSVLVSLPSNICLTDGSTRGYGACGFNSFCSLGTDRRPICGCPKGYSVVDPNDRMSGCKPNFVPQNCDEETREIELFSFSEMLQTDWVGSDYDGYEGVSEEWCRKVCLADCFCAAVVYESNKCWKKRFPFSRGRIDSSVTGKSLIKVRNNNETFIPPGNDLESKKGDHTDLIITGSVLLGSSVFLNCLLLVSALFFVFRLKGRNSKMVQPYSVLSRVNARSFSFNELQEATNGFDKELGRGAFSVVYKGALKNENDKAIAVKKLNRVAVEAEEEFKAEVTSISKTNHKNLVQLLGYCDEGQNRLLVYEFMSNGSLASFLFENSRPNWYQRVQIAFGTARGLCYLHEECSTQIIHCDIKPQNVLLDECLNAKIADFGLAKLLRPDQTRTTTGIRGTRGYVAPEWFRNMPITVKVDVYSFGILLLELVCCRKNVETDVENENEMILADWAYDCYKDGATKLLVWKDEDAINDIKRVEKFLMIGIWCIQEDPSLRPNMKRVMHMLEGSVVVPIPPDPESFIS